MVKIKGFNHLEYQLSQIADKYSADEACVQELFKKKFEQYKKQTINNEGRIYFTWYKEHERALYVVENYLAFKHRSKNK